MDITKYRSTLHSNITRLSAIIRKREQRRQTLSIDHDAATPTFTFCAHNRILEPKNGSRSSKDHRYSGPMSMDASLSVYVSTIHNKKGDKTANATVMYLDFSNTQNLESSFLKPLKTFENLTVLSLSNTGLKHVPKTILKMHGNLQFIDLSNNYISEIPSKAKWTNIRGLNLRNNKFIRWPDVVNPSFMPKLEFLDLSYNTIIAGIPQTMVFEQMKHISLAYCGLVQFPPFIENLLSLKSLDISGNSELQFFSLHNLESVLSLQYINLQSIRVLETSVNQHFPPNLVITKYSQFKIPHLSNTIFIN